MLISKYISKQQMTVAEAARDFGCGDQTMRHWVNRNRIPRPAQMNKIAQWSKGAVTPNDFFEESSL